MKKTLIAVALMLAGVMAMAQNTTTTNTAYKRDGKTFVEQKSQVLKGDTITAYTWRDAQGKEYPIILHRYTKGEKAGKVVAYVIRVSKKTGNEYRYFLPDGEKIAQEILVESK